MLLKLTNFRCWKNKTFEFPDEGLVLLNGCSGAGKSSILNAIYFAIYGVGTKVISTGEKKCMVRFVYNNLDITRTKGPNRLILVHTIDGEKKEYEDDVAQGVITKQFGTNFTLTSYITQKTVQSFLNLGPTDKMNFLEQLALGDQNISEIKKTAKEKVKERKEILQQKVGQLEMMIKEVGDMEIPTEVEFPLGKKHSDIKIKNESIYWKRTVKELDSVNSELKMLESSFSKEKVDRAVKSGKEKMLLDLQSQLAVLDKELKGLYFEGDDNITELKSTLSYLKNKREFSSITDRYKEEKTRYDNLYNQEMDVLKSEALELKTELASIDADIFSDKMIKDTETKIVTIDRINSLNKEIMDLEKKRSKYKDIDRKSEIERLESLIESLQKEIVSTEQRFDIRCCPNCKTSLRFIKTQLVIADGNPVDESKSRSEIKRIQSEISSYKLSIDILKKESNTILDLDTKITEYKTRLEKETVPKENITTLKEKIKDLNEKKKEFKELNDNIKLIDNKISNNDLSSTLKKLKIQLDKRKKEYDTVKSQIDEEIETDYTEDELQEEISNQQLLSQKSSSLIKQIKDLQKSIDKTHVEIKKIILSERDFETDIDNLNTQLDILKQKEKDHKQMDDKIKNYLQYKREHDEYMKWQSKLDICRSEEEDAKKQLFYTDLFLRKILESESIAIAQTIETINYHMNFYLEKFFPNDPITVAICPYKETKKDIKPSINLEIGYKGTLTDINSLSGGEYDRVTLSIVLALNTIFGSNILMLDESISSLDADLTNDILEVLKDNLSEKVVIVVAHQISVGVFDCVVNVE